MAELPSGTVTFLFTDLEGSTRLWEEQREAMQSAPARHDAVLRDAVESHGGDVSIRTREVMTEALLIGHHACERLSPIRLDLRRRHG